MEDQSREKGEGIEKVVVVLLVILVLQDGDNLNISQASIASLFNNL
jgi:hypothetical protein